LAESVESSSLLLQVVVKSVFVALADSDLDTFVSPQAFECVHAVQRHRFLRADFWVSSDNFCETLRDCQYTWIRGKAGIRQAYNVGFVCKVNFLLLHGAENDLKRVQQVVEDGDLPLLSLR
jgi:hypothetical protein